jgi:uncharacterized protein
MFAAGILLGGGHGVTQDRAAAQAWFARAAERGHGFAALMLGRYLVRDLAAAPDPAAGRAWLERGRACGIMEAERDLPDLPRMPTPAAPGQG